MNALTRALLGGWVTIAVAVGCSTSVTDPDSETHWLRVCNVDADCGRGLSCLCGTCTRSCASDSCDSISARAKCVNPTPAAVAAECQTPPNTAICTASCANDADCTALGSSLECIGGACLAGSAAQHLVDGGEAGTGGRGQPAWQGVPCNECDLETQVARLSDPASEDCGTIQIDPSTTNGADCAHAALRAARPFKLIIEGAGTDSAIGTAWIFESGRLHIISYDSNICGGVVAACESPGCGPRVVSETCVDPAASSAPASVFECSAWTDDQTICGPGSPR